MDELSNDIPKLRVLLIQLPVPNNPDTNVPLAAGYLKAHAQARGLLDRVEIDILPRALADNAGDALLVDAIVARRPALLGISLYTWNSERSLAIATRVKAQLPGLLVVVGGPEVQPDNDWVLNHPAVDVAVIGEGEQTFAELLRQLDDQHKTGDARPETEVAHLVDRVSRLASLAGLAYRDTTGALIFTPERVPLSDLAPLPSPYLLGYLEPGQILMVEISRWCPYSCGFCLYGRNMGPKLGSRYFPLERILAEISWGRAHGATQIHFVEANLNLVPVFWPLMRALEDLNADGALTLYAELRGEHLTDESVAALARAGLRVAEVGLQTANLAALKVAQRKTDLQKWAAGTRRLARAGVEIYLDVILGLPGDDAAGVATTLDFIQREDLGPYDVFTLQVLAGTATRRQVAEYGLVHQDRPPYYVLATDRLDYSELRRLRHELKHGAGLDPDEIEGCPSPRLQIADCRVRIELTDRQFAICNLQLVDADDASWTIAKASVTRLTWHVDVVTRWRDAQQLATLLEHAISENPSTLFDCYLIAETPPQPSTLRDWQAALPYSPGYLDRVAVYRRQSPKPDHQRVSPRLWLILPWTAQVAPEEYAGVAEIIWMYDMAEGEMPPFGAWAVAGGAGVWLRGVAAEQVSEWRQSCELRLWSC
ncbi:MAG: cobalamin-dependent protein [Roseiflexaceae bacterium]